MLRRLVLFERAILPIFVLERFIFAPLRRIISHRKDFASPRGHKGWEVSHKTARHRRCSMEDRFKRGVPQHVLQQLHMALQHRHKIMHQQEPTVSSLWRSLGETIHKSGQSTQQTTTKLQLLLDIDNTLLSTTFLADVFEDGPRQFGDPDLQQFHRLAQHFWQWRTDALTCYSKGKHWPSWAPFAKIGGRELSMWFPVVSTEDAQTQHWPVPEFIQPVYDKLSGSLTHYIVMFGGAVQLSTTDANGKPELRVWQAISVIPAEVTLLTFLRYDFAQYLDDLRARNSQSSSACHNAAAPASGPSKVDLYLASCGNEPYVKQLCSILETILGCQHAGVHGKVFAGAEAFDQHDGTIAGCKGIKNLGPFKLQEPQDGVICPRLVVDDQIAVWGVTEQEHKLKLMPIAPWKSRWFVPTKAEIAAAAIEDCLESYDKALDKENITASQANIQDNAAKPVLTPQLLPPPDGLTRLLSEVVKLITASYAEANQAASRSSDSSEPSTAAGLTAYSSLEAPTCSSDDLSGSDAELAPRITSDATAISSGVDAIRRPTALLSAAVACTNRSCATVELVATTTGSAAMGAVEMTVEMHVTGFAGTEAGDVKRLFQHTPQKQLSSSCLPEGRLQTGSANEDPAAAAMPESRAAPVVAGKADVDVAAAVVKSTHWKKRLLSELSSSSDCGSNSEAEESHEEPGKRVRRQAES